MACKKGPSPAKKLDPFNHLHLKGGACYAVYTDSVNSASE